MLLAGGHGVACAGSAAALCKERKARAAGRKASDLLQAIGKNSVSPNVTRLGFDVSKAGSRFTQSFTKADAKGGCVITDDAAQVAATVDAFVRDAVGSIAPVCGDDVKAPAEACDGTDDGACPGFCGSGCTCVPFCGNGTIDPGEECDGTDDGACPGLCGSGCTCVRFCGNGAIDPGEECDDGNQSAGDGCDGSCLDEDQAAAIVAAGQPVTTDDDGDPGATPGDPVETTVTSPNPGLVAITETTVTVSPPPALELIRQEVIITAPTATANDPIEILFVIDASELVLGADASSVQAFRNEAVVPGCTGSPGVASPDPCVSDRVFSDDARVTVLTSEAGRWTFAVSPDCCALVPDTVDVVVDGMGTCGTLRNFRCSNNTNAACAAAADCNFGSCIVGPNICSGNFALMCPGGDADCQGTCEEVVALLLPLDLECNALHFGAGAQPVMLRVTTLTTKVTSCDPTTGTIILAATTDLEASDDTCTSTGCAFGVPVPIPVYSTPSASHCGILTMREDASGRAMCNGHAELSLPLTLDLTLTGDVLSAVPGTQACPLCARVCLGGSNAGLPCAANADCDSNVCDVSTQCLGGPNDGNGCVPGGVPAGQAFATSQDCPPYPPPPPPWNGLDPLPVPLDVELTTGEIVGQAPDLNAGTAGSRVFCGFCRDSFGGGSLCFEGNPGSGCPTATPVASGNAVACKTDDDCDDGDEYESCAQRTSGAFREAAATRLDLRGSPVVPGQGPAATLVSSFCIPPSFDGTTDASLDIPGPGAISLRGSVGLVELPGE
jgi:cysteine-rich repeat protein